MKNESGSALIELLLVLAPTGTDAGILSASI
jgi:hypothetical protein